MKKAIRNFISKSIIILAVTLLSGSALILSGINISRYLSGNPLLLQEKAWTSLFFREAPSPSIGTVEKSETLDQRERVLNLLQESLDNQQEKFLSAQETPQGLVQQGVHSKQGSARIQKLANIYAAMPAEQALILLEHFNDEALVALLTHMPEQSAGQILTAYTSQKGSSKNKKAYQERAIRISKMIWNAEKA